MYYVGKYDYSTGLIELITSPETGEPIMSYYLEEAEEYASYFGGEVMTEEYLIVMGVLS